MTMCWAIWHARNRFVFEELKLDPILVMTNAEAVKEAFRRTKFPELLNLEIMQKKKPKVWIPPPQGWVKINVDAVTNTKRQCSRL